jgi:hypothetical protein
MVFTFAIAPSTYCMLNLKRNAALQKKRMEIAKLLLVATGQFCLAS